MVTRTISIITLLLLSATVVPSYGGLTTRLDRSQIQINETVRLIVETDDADSNEDPDFASVAKHFNVIGTATSQNMSIVNGKQTSVKRWTLELQPRAIGSFSLDPIKVGTEQSQRLRIAVMPQSDVASRAAEVFLETELDINQPYVQQQVILTVRLFLDKRLLDGALADPTPVDTLVKRVGEDVRYETTRGDKQFSVYQRRYALFPQKSGTLEIPPVGFQGLMDDAGGGSQSEFGGFFQQGKRVRAQTKTLQLEVKSPPDNFTGQAWMPAKQIIIKDVGEPNVTFKVGQPVTRKIQVSALGMTSEQLPDISFTEADGLRYYPDQPVGENQDDTNNIIGLQLNSVAIIPAKSGSLEIPGIQINWWNTETETMETASLPPKKIDVAPGVESANTIPGIVAESLNQLPADLAFAPTTQNSEKIWKWLSVLSITLWVFTVLYYLYQRHGQNKVIQTVSSGENLKESGWLAKFRSACQHNNPGFARKYLLGWANEHFGKPITLEQLVDTFDDIDLSNQLRLLDQFLYSAHSSQGHQRIESGGETRSSPPWSGHELWSCMARVLADSSAQKQSESDDLLPLYP